MRQISKMIGLFFIVRGFLRIRSNTRADLSVKGAFDFAKALKNLDLYKHSFAHLAKDANFKQLLLARTGVKTRFSRDLLQSCGQGTLGQGLYKLAENGYDPEFYRKYIPEPTNDAEWLSFRLIQIHDIAHIVTGYPPNGYLGEIAVFSFLTAQNHSYASFFVVAGGIFSVASKQAKDLPKAMRILSKAWLAGEKAVPLISVRFEDRLNENLADIRRSLAISETGLADDFD